MIYELYLNKAVKKREKHLIWTKDQSYYYNELKLWLLKANVLS